MDPYPIRYERAIHEAAHCAVAKAMGRDIAYLELTDDGGAMLDVRPEKTRVKYFADLTPAQNKARRVFAENIREIAILEAGMAAQRNMIYGATRAKAITQMGRKDLAAIEQLFPPPGPVQRKRGKSIAERIVKEHWYGIRWLAEELVRRGRIEAGAQILDYTLGGITNREEWLYS
ncbi:MAG TPA: hypothetical protein VH518_04160 [Tepidisphaeraceae bacterium]|jgi:hypothetical protein